MKFEIKIIIVIGLLSIIFQNTVYYKLGKMNKGVQHQVGSDIVSVYRPQGNDVAVPIKYHEKGNVIESNEAVCVYLKYDYENDIKGNGQYYTAVIAAIVLLLYLKSIFK